MFVVKSKHGKFLFKKAFVSYYEARRYLTCFLLASQNDTDVDKYWIVSLD